VYVLSDDRLRRQAVILGTLSAGDARQVLSGVVAGDRVVVAPTDGLTDGAAASVKP
jgi:multidrug efflux pump subunit AcrA (membrane-fusion protein)